MRAFLATIVGLAISLTGQELRELEEEYEEPQVLPEWTEVEWESIQSGEFIPGSSLLGRIALERLNSDTSEPIELDPTIRELPEEEPDPEEWSRVIKEEFLPAYFYEGPRGFFNDPQQLLTTQEYRDREGFLNYHARDTDIDFYIYLFDMVQDVPEGESLEEVVKAHFDSEKPAAVVYYFLGMPERSQLVFSERVVEAVDESEREKVLRMAVEEALEKSDPSSQLESFSIQLSIRLYWLEKVVAKGQGSLSGRRPVILPRARIAKAEQLGMWRQLQSKPGLFYSLSAGVVLTLAATLGLAGRWFAERQRIYVFPDAVGAPLMDAPCAAGVGGVISFSSSTHPPSSQKNDVPDYLQKI